MKGENVRMISVPKCGGVVEGNLFGYCSWKAQYNGKQLYIGQDQWRIQDFPDGSGRQPQQWMRRPRSCNFQNFC